jgi:formate hydrogenlyase subunit 3/multisubunit Na+/H+ antiporter MnhD subunit
MYTIILGVTIILLRTLKVFKLNDILHRGYGGSVIIGLQFLNMGGLPPFVGFMLKVLIIKGILLFRRGLAIALIFVRLLMIYLYTTTLYQVYCAVNNYDHNSGRPLPIYVSTA